MHPKTIVILMAALVFPTSLLRAQTPCPTIPVVVNSPEDKLMLEYNGADNPQDQVTALEKFAQEHADSRYIPCVNEYLTVAYLKLKNVDKAIESGEKDLALNYSDLFLTTNLLKAYIAAGKTSDAGFTLIAKAPDLIKAELTPARPTTVSEDDWKKIQSEAESNIKDERAFMEYAFFQLLARVADANKRVQFLDAFVKAFPDSQSMEQVDFQYFLAYSLANNPDKADEYGEKAIASDPTNVEFLNAVSNDYATREVNLDKATDYAKKVIGLVPAMKKPEGVTDDQFRSEQNNQLGLAHATLGYVAMSKGSKTHRVAPAIQELKAAVDLLAGNPTLQGRTLYYLGYAYEVLYPPNHKLAAEALERSATINSPWQAQAKDLLAKVKKAESR